MTEKKIKKLLIANRGEIACKIIRCAKKLNILTLAIYSDADIKSLHTELADEAIHIPGILVSDTYMNGSSIIQIAKKYNANAIHPGYGLLSENADFVKNVEENGLIFVGPNSDVVRKMGEKDKAKTIMEKAGLPVVPGYHGNKQQLNYLENKADEIGFPLLIKARSGGGGRGKRVAENKKKFSLAFQEASNEAKTIFNDKHCLLEKYIPKARHIEIQIFADKFGNVYVSCDGPNVVDPKTIFPEVSSSRTVYGGCIPVRLIVIDAVVSYQQFIVSSTELMMSEFGPIRLLVALE
jgi:3-methylcrotonyl-CoA carboxylase alpha subunit